MLTMNVGGTAATATPGVAATSLARTNVHGTGTIRPEVEATRAASAHPTGLMTMFSIRPTGWPAMSITLEPLATGTNTGEVVVVVVVCCVAGTTGVKGACAKPAVAARTNPVAQSADLICVLFISNTFLLVIFYGCTRFLPKSLGFKAVSLNWVLTPKPAKSSQSALNQRVFRGRLPDSRMELLEERLLTAVCYGWATFWRKERGNDRGGSK
jgi:hypothetical protein